MNNSGAERSEWSHLSGQYVIDRTAILAVIVRRPCVADGGFYGKAYADSSLLIMCRKEFLEWFLVDCFLAMRCGSVDFVAKVLLIRCLQLWFVILQIFRNDLCGTSVGFLVEIDSILSNNSENFKSEQKIDEVKGVSNLSYSLELSHSMELELNGSAQVFRLEVKFCGIVYPFAMGIDFSTIGAGVITASGLPLFGLSKEVWLGLPRRFGDGFRRDLITSKSMNVTTLFF
ncbi:hypothetical protein M5K25_013483 [Dendrobium thyrsiflorum]|uniref:Uncharacterized protein n=1 Tax=Dendrobium thyrsiflorum TaxID=117978 RepID=A0ABD0UT48_DENTH